MTPSSVLVLGAGELGLAILKALANHPSRKTTRLAVLLRPATVHSTNEEKRKHIDNIEDLGIDIVEGDLVESTIVQLATTLSKFDTVVNCSGMTAPPGTQLRIAQAAISSSSHRYFPWQFGVDYDIIGRDSAQDLFTEQLDVRDLLRSQSRLTWVIVSTGIFTSYIFEPSFGIVSEDRRTVTALGGWENEITATTVEDIGSLTAEMVLMYPELEGKLFTAGDTVSMRDVANIVDSVLNTEVFRVEKSADQLAEESAADPQNGSKKYRAVFGKGIGVSWAKDRTFNVQKQIATQTVEEWAREHLIQRRR